MLGLPGTQAEELLAGGRGGGDDLRLPLARTAQQLRRQSVEGVQLDAQQPAVQGVRTVDGELRVPGVPDRVPYGASARRAGRQQPRTRLLRPPVGWIVRPPHGTVLRRGAEDRRVGDRGRIAGRGLPQQPLHARFQTLRGKLDRPPAEPGQDDAHFLVR
ncbi:MULTISPECIES: hypothetical protein [unclassified Streptomyces]|uniref:hypothetical protein n=1 Tax=unclassified Streptomyces TaxID=2593676 RepID=UPI001EFECC78|nr:MULTISPECIES: hypothetical protein [unclassified Streptomyces]